MKREDYLKTKSALRDRVCGILEHLPVSQNDVDEYVLHYLAYDEPQIAYTNLVALLIDKQIAISMTVYNQIIQLGLDLDISNGVTWDSDQTDGNWKQLVMLIQ